MKAAIIRNPGPDSSVSIGEREAPEPEHGQIRVRVAASALNRADLLQRMGRYPAPSSVPPDIGGLEYSGTVDAVGSGVTLWSAGDRVMGIVAGAAHAEAVVVHEREALPVPNSVDLVQAAAIPEAFLTAYDALSLQLGVRAGRTVLIHAVGSGVGTAAVQIARRAGAVTIGTSRTAEKLERAAALGLDYSVVADHGWSDRVREIAPDGVDAILDLVGASYLDGNLRSLGRRGHLLVVGLVGGVEAPINLGRLLNLRGLITGTVLRSRPLEEKIALARNFAAEVLPAFGSGQLAAVVHSVIPFEEIEEGYRAMAANETYGKIVMRW